MRSRKGREYPNVLLTWSVGFHSLTCEEIGKKKNYWGTWNLWQVTEIGWKSKQYAASGFTSVKLGETEGGCWVLIPWKWVLNTQARREINLITSYLNWIVVIWNAEEKKNQGGKEIKSRNHSNSTLAPGKSICYVVSYLSLKKKRCGEHKERSSVSEFVNYVFSDTWDCDNKQYFVIFLVLIDRAFFVHFLFTFFHMIFLYGINFSFSLCDIYAGLLHSNEWNRKRNKLKIGQMVWCEKYVSLCV